MKISLISPMLGGDYSALDIAITQLATYLNERTDHDASIIDFTFHRKDWEDHLRRQLFKKRPDITGITVNNLYWGHAKRIADAVKNHGLEVIAGGYHASIDQNVVLAHPSIDYICMGDGEKPMEGFLDLYEDDWPIPKKFGGTFNQDINSLPIPDWDLWDDLDKYFKYLNMLYVIGSRGCPYRCTFCSAASIQDHVNGSYYRVRDPVDFANELNCLWDRYYMKFMEFQIFDQIFTADRRWVKAFTDEYKKLGLHEEVGYSVFSRIDHLNKRKINMLAKSNCNTMRVGVESGNDHIRNNVYGKNLSKKQIRSVFAMCDDAGINLTAFYMLGGPQETKDTLWETLKFAWELGSRRSAFFVYKPFAGTESAELVAQMGGTVSEEFAESKDNITFGAVVDYPDMSAKYVERFQFLSYALTAGRRGVEMLFSHPHWYPFSLAKYVYDGVRDGLDWHYLLPYYHIYHSKNILR